MPLHLSDGVLVALITQAGLLVGGVALWFRQNHSARIAKDAKSSVSNNQFSVELIEASREDAKIARSQVEKVQAEFEIFRRASAAERIAWADERKLLHTERQELEKNHAKERKQWFDQTKQMKVQLDECTKQHHAAKP